MDNGTVNGSAVLQAKLNEPQTIAALTRLLDRIDSLEGTVAKLETAVRQMPGMMAMAADTVDDAYRQAAEQGIDLDARIRATMQLAEKLTAPAMVAQVDNLLAMAAQAPGLAAITADAVDDAYKRASDRGVDIDSRLRAGLEIAEKLTSPQMLAQLNQLLTLAEQAPGLMGMVADGLDDAYRQASRNGIDIDTRLRAGLDIANKLTSPDMVTKLDAAINMANQGPGLVAMAMDVVDDTYQQAVNNGTDPEKLIRQGMMVMSRMADLLESGEVNNLLDSGIVDPAAVKVIGSTAQALVESRAQPPQSVNLFGMLKGMRDPDLQRAIGFLMQFGKQFGQKL